MQISSCHPLLKIRQWFPRLVLKICNGKLSYVAFEAHSDLDQQASLRAIVPPAFCPSHSKEPPSGSGIKNVSSRKENLGAETHSVLSCVFGLLLFDSQKHIFCPQN